MKHVLQVRFGGATEHLATLSDDGRQRVTEAFEAIRQLPEVVEARRMHGAETAVTVRVLDGEPTTVAGPPVETLDALDGYYVIEGDLEVATRVAARIPVAALGGTVEVRPLRGD